MVGLVVRLKLRLLRGALRSPARLALVLLGAAFGLLVVALLGAALVYLRDTPATVAAAGTLVAAVLAIGWATVPIAAFGVDETLDVSRLALLPIRRDRLLAGLLAGALIGVPPLLTALLVGVTVAAVVTSWPAVPVAVVAFVLLLAMLLLLGRVTTSALSRLLRSRRGRDLAVVVGLFVVLAAQLPRLLVENLDEQRLVRIGEVLRWTPPGAAVRAVADAAAGSWGPALLSLAYSAATVALLLAGWYAALGAALTVVDASTTSARRRSGLRGGRLGAVAGKDLRYAWREPRLKFSWLQMMVFGVAVPGFALWDEGRFLPLAAATFSALLVAALQFNLLGPEGTAFWLTVVTTGTERDARTDLAGRNAATAAVALAWIVPAAVVLAAVAGSGVRSVLVSVGAAAAVLGAGLAVGTVISVLAPYPMPDQPSAAFTGPGPGRGCLAGVLWIVGALVTVALALPAVVPALAWGDSWPVALAVAAGGPAWGACLAWVGRRIAAQHLVTRLPELLVAVTPDRT